MALLDKLKIGGVTYDAWATKDQVGSASDASSATTVFGKIKAVFEHVFNLAQFFGLPEALPGSYVPAAEAEILLELESIWEDVTGELAPLSSFSTDTAQRVVTDGVVSYRSIVPEEIG